jgi:hypothetical protein
MIMTKKISLCAGALLCALSVSVCFAEQAVWKDGGPEYLYPKVGEKPAHHDASYPHDEQLKCMDCHQYDGVDAYTSATMTLKKSKVGRMSRVEIEKAIIDALKGKGNHREMYVLSTAFNNKPLATCIEFTLDTKTLTFYASSEKQTEKLFHMVANPNVSMVYVKNRDDKEYFTDPLGVQIVGKAVTLKASDPEFMAALNYSLATINIPITPELIEYIKKTQIVTKVIPERIVISNSEFRKGGFHFKQIWEAQ